MNKYKYLAKNLGLLTLSNFGTKILSFILIPIYTAILSTADYGLYDIYNTTVSLCIPILTLNIAESVMRFSLDKEYNTSDVFSIGLNRIVKASLVFTVIVVINYFCGIVELLKEYSCFLVLLFVSELTYEFLSKYSRGIEDINTVAIASILNSITMLGLNIFLLVVIKAGLKGYFLANCLSYIIPAFYYIVHLKVWNSITELSDNKLKGEMFAYSKPLVLNTISWWINNASDRYIVTWLCGVAENGVYSVAYKIPSILNVFQSIFNQAWTLSAVKEFENNDDGFYANIYDMYNFAITTTCSILILADKMIARLLFANDFYIAWKYAPFLMISVVFGALSGFLGGVFSAAKKSTIYSKTTLIGAITNIFFDVLLVYRFGTIGAAIATAISYIVVWTIRLIEVKKIINFELKLSKHILSYSILILQATLLLFQMPEIVTFISQAGLVVAIIFLYRKEIVNIARKAYLYVGINK